MRILFGKMKEKILQIISKDQLLDLKNKLVLILDNHMQKFKLSSKMLLIMIKTTNYRRNSIANHNNSYKTNKNIMSLSIILNKNKYKKRSENKVHQKKEENNNSHTNKKILLKLIKSKLPNALMPTISSLILIVLKGI